MFNAKKMISSSLPIILVGNKTDLHMERYAFESLVIRFLNFVTTFMCLQGAPSQVRKWRGGGKLKTK